MTNFSLYAEGATALDENEKREKAVLAALELIKSQVEGGSSVSLPGLMPKLSEYADLIQEALKTSNLR